MPRDGFAQALDVYKIPGSRLWSLEKWVEYYEPEWRRHFEADPEFKKWIAQTAVPCRISIHPKDSYEEFVREHVCAGISRYDNQARQIQLSSTSKIVELNLYFRDTWHKKIQSEVNKPEAPLIILE
jgi:hypothetical protein